MFLLIIKKPLIVFLTLGLYIYSVNLQKQPSKTFNEEIRNITYSSKQLKSIKIKITKRI